MDFWIYMTIVVCLGMILSIIFRSQRRSRNAATFTSKQTDKKFSLQSFNKKFSAPVVVTSDPTQSAVRPAPYHIAMQTASAPAGQQSIQVISMPMPYNNNQNQPIFFSQHHLPPTYTQAVGSNQPGFKTAYAAN